MKSMKKPNILFYFGGFSPVGGIETFSYNLLTHLDNHGYGCRLLCWGRSSRLLEKLEKTNIQVLRYFWRWGCKWHLPDRLLLAIGQKQVQNADLVIFGKLFPTSILKRLQQSKPLHSKWIYITPYRPHPPELIADRQKLLERLNLFDTIVVQAKSFEDDLRELDYTGVVEVIPYIPPQPQAIQPFPQGETLKIGFLGRLVPDKNLPLLLNAFQLFRDTYRSHKFPAVELHLFGDGALRIQLENLAKTLNIESSVVFHGTIPQDQVQEKIADCHMFAFTSHVEGQCLAALEILACGRPIVATQVGALPDILADRRLGGLASMATPPAFADKLREITQSIEQNVLIPETIHESYLERYAPAKVGDRYIKLMDMLFKQDIRVKSMI
jgi:glycosyltransferase involved in cell wall biosynthesis